MGGKEGVGDCGTRDGPRLYPGSTSAKLIRSRASPALLTLRLSLPHSLFTLHTQASALRSLTLHFSRAIPTSPCTTCCIASRYLIARQPQTPIHPPRPMQRDASQHNPPHRTEPRAEHLNCPHEERTIEGRTRGSKARNVERASLVVDRMGSRRAQFEYVQQWHVK
jgi:hypothetical protein